MENNLEMDEEQLIDKEESEEMGIDEHSEGEGSEYDSVDSSEEREAHHALERKIVELRKEVWLYIIFC